MFVFRGPHPESSENTPNFKTEPLPSATRHVLVINTAKISPTVPDSVCVFFNKKQD